MMTLSVHICTCIGRQRAWTCRERNISAKPLVKITIIVCRGQGNWTITIEVYFLPCWLKLNCFKGSFFLPRRFEWSGQQARWLIYASKSCRKSCPANLNLYLSPWLYISLDFLQSWGLYFYVKIGIFHWLKTPCKLHKWSSMTLLR